MDENAPWYGSRPLTTRPRPRPHCTRRGPSSRERGTAAPLFWAHVYCGHGRPSQLLLSSCSNYTETDDGQQQAQSNSITLSWSQTVRSWSKPHSKVRIWSQTDRSEAGQRSASSCYSSLQASELDDRPNSSSLQVCDQDSVMEFDCACC